MYQFFVEPNQINEKDKSVTMVGTDVNHVKNVLRMKPGEKVLVSNGQDGKTYQCEIADFAEDMVYLQLLAVSEDTTELPGRIYLFQGLPKADKMEWIVQKAVELGVYEVIPVATKRCVVKLDDKKAKGKISRWQGIAEAAAKQSKRSVIPKVADPMTFGEALQYASGLDVRIIPYEHAEDMRKTREIVEAVRPGQSVAVFIGPEGGFEESEIEKALAAGVEPITLGKRILRTETAGLTVLSWLTYQLEDFQ